MSYDLKTLSRGLDLLLAIVDTGPATLTELCRRLGTHKTTALRTLRVLEDYGLLLQDPKTKAYHPGARLLNLVTRVASSSIVVTQLRRHLEQLSHEFHETIHLGILKGPSVVVVDKVEPPESIVRYTLLGTALPLHCTGMGKAILASLSPEECSDLLAGHLEPFTTATIVDRAALEGELQATRLRGYALDRGEYQAGFNCVAVSLAFGSDHYAVSITNPQGAASNEDRKLEQLLRLKAEFEPGPRDVLTAHRWPSNAGAGT